MRPLGTGPRNALGDPAPGSRSTAAPTLRPKTKSAVRAGVSSQTTVGRSRSPLGERAIPSRQGRAAQGTTERDDLLPFLPDAMQLLQRTASSAEKPPLPALAHREEVVEAVRQNRVTILSGETGSGKTTQVPQFLVDEPDLVPEGKMIVVTQPRRIACITIAERVAQERGEVVGESVGYQIRFVNNTSPSTKLIFCTTAVLLRKLYSDPNLDKISVLCVDEVHERDVYTEFLLIAVRERLLRGEMKLKLVLMSATLSAEMFTDFFAELRCSWGANGEPPDLDPESSVNIEGRMFPVKEHFLEDAFEWTGHELPNASTAQRATMQKIQQRLLDATGKRYSKSTLRSMAVAGERDVHQSLILELVALFHSVADQAGDCGRGGILVFLPGWAEIASLHARLKEKEGLWPLMLHSSLYPEEQRRVFEHPPDGRRKVVLSTNIAETSVTIDDIVFVINSGVMKERVFDADRQLGSLETSLNTWANATQRAGRAGRTQEGVVVHLFPKWKFGELKKWPTPEILSKSLEEVVLNVLALGLGDPHEVLAKSISKPSVEAVEHAVWLLQEMGMMGSEEEASANEALLPLGRWLAPIPLHPMSSKALLYGAMFGVLLPVTACVAFLNIKNPFVQPAAEVVLAGGKEALSRGKHSDHYGMAAAYLGWRRAEAVGEGEAFIEYHGLSRETLEMGDQLVRSLQKMMVEEYDYDGDDAAFIDNTDSGSYGVESVFDDRSWKLCKAALSAAFTPFFVRFSDGRFESDSNEEVQAHGSSVNSKYQPINNPYSPADSTTDEWLLYTDAMKLGKVSIMESTVVGAPYVLLFAKTLKPTAGGGSWQTNGVSIQFDGWRGILTDGPAALHDLQVARRHLHDKVLAALETQIIAALDDATLDSILELLGDKRFLVTNVVGTREQRIGSREAATLYVGNIADEVDEEQLHALFGQFGRVEEVNLACDRDTGMRRGFGFVTMGDKEEADLASRHISGYQFHGRALRLDFKGSSSGKFNGRGRGAPPIVYAKPAERRTWIREPTEAERTAVAETFRLQSLTREKRAAEVAAAGGPAAKRQKRAASEVASKVSNSIATKDAPAASQPAVVEIDDGERDGIKFAASSREKVTLVHSEAEASPAGTSHITGHSHGAVSSTAPPGNSAGSSAASVSYGSLGRWSELLVEVAHVKVRKKRAAAFEDYAEASRLKRLEKELVARISEAELQAKCRGSEEEILLLQDAKRKAVEAEDFAEASRLKKCLNALQEESPDSPVSPEELEGRAWKSAFALVSKLQGGPREAQAVAAELRAAAPAGVARSAIDARAAVSTSLSRSSSAVGGDLLDKTKPAAPVKEELVEDGSSHTGLPKPRASASLASAAAQASKTKEKQVGAAMQTAATAKFEFKSEKEEAKDQAAHESGLSIAEFVKMSNEDLWQHTWAVTWQQADAEGKADNHDKVYADAQKAWKQWMKDRDRMGKEQAMAEGRRRAEEILRTSAAAPTSIRPKAAAVIVAGIEVQRPKELSEELFSAQLQSWSANKAAQKEWEKLCADLEKRRKAKEEGTKSSRDLCTIVKQRCPADQPLQFERLLAVCPKGTTVRQLVQAMAKEPQEFRQSWDASEYCVRPCNSRCVDWLPVQASKTPPGFRQDASVPEEMWEAAQCVFEDRIKPASQVGEDPLIQFLMMAGRLPCDAPLTFEEIFMQCPPGTSPRDLIVSMGKKREVFKQSSSGTHFCMRPRVKCKDFGPVNPYLDSAKLFAQPQHSGQGGGSRADTAVVAKEEDDDGEY